MSVLGAPLAIGIVAVAGIAAAAYGFGGVDALRMAGFDSQGLDCSGPLVPFQDPDGTAALRIKNTGDAIRVHICIYDSERQKRIDEWRDLDARSEPGFAFDVERKILAVIVRVDGPWTGGSSNVVNNRMCEATITYIDTHVTRGGISIGSGGEGPSCGKVASAQRSDAGGIAVPFDLDDRGLGGGPLATGVLAATVGLAVPMLLARRRLQFLLLGLFTRLQRPRVLDQETRARIHELIQVEPGIHASEIADRLELAGSHVVHHLRVLVQQEIVVDYRGFGRRHYFARGRFSPIQMRTLSALRHDSMRRVFQVIQSNPGVSLSEVSRKAGLSLPRASRLVRGLSEAGLLRRTPTGREIRLSVAV